MQIKKLHVDPKPSTSKKYEGSHKYLDLTMPLSVEFDSKNGIVKLESNGVYQELVWGCTDDFPKFYDEFVESRIKSIIYPTTSDETFEEWRRLKEEIKLNNTEKFVGTSRYAFKDVEAELMKQDFLEDKLYKEIPTIGNEKFAFSRVYYYIAGSCLRIKISYSNGLVFIDEFTTKQKAEVYHPWVFQQKTPFPECVKFIVEDSIVRFKEYIDYSIQQYCESIASDLLKAGFKVAE